ncbi:MAG: hypothetical protein QM740_06115 [Acidovorax sp.]
MTKCCACCGNIFVPRPQVPNQAFCASPDCQRARKRQWQRDKLQSDPTYRINQRAAQLAWTQRNQDYWPNYRATRPEYRQRNREQQQMRDANRPVAEPVKMDVCDLPSGLYRITRRPDFPKTSSDSWVVEITPIDMTRSRKMDASREDFIDISAFRS